METGKMIGRVKWFNGTMGYGFITCIEDGDRKDTEVFVHQSQVKPESQTYRTLYKGEYVSLDLGNHKDKPNEKMATNVTGVLGYPLQCDVREEENQRRKERQAKKQQEAVVVDGDGNTGDREV